MVRPLITAEVPRTANAPTALLPSIVITPAPGPAIVSVLVMSIVGGESEIVPASPFWKVIVSPATASRIAWRSEPGPSLLVLVTVGPAARAGAARNGAGSFG